LETFLLGEKRGTNRIHLDHKKQGEGGKGKGVCNRKGGKSITLSWGVKKEGTLKEDARLEDFKGPGRGGEGGGGKSLLRGKDPPPVSEIKKKRMNEAIDEAADQGRTTLNRERRGQINQSIEKTIGCRPRARGGEILTVRNQPIKGRLAFRGEEFFFCPIGGIGFTTIIIGPQPREKKEYVEEKQKCSPDEGKQCRDLLDKIR